MELNYPCAARTIGREPDPVLGVSNEERCHPLVIVLASLRGNRDDLRGATEVDLQPLAPPVVARRPGPAVVARPADVESRPVGGVVAVKAGRGAQLAVQDALVFHTERKPRRC